MMRGGGVWLVWWRPQIAVVAQAASEQHQVASRQLKLEGEAGIVQGRVLGLTEEIAAARGRQQMSTRERQRA